MKNESETLPKHSPAELTRKDFAIYFFTVFFSFSLPATVLLYTYHMYQNKSALSSLAAGQQNHVREHRLRVHERIDALQELISIYIDHPDSSVLSQSRQQMPSAAVMKNLILHNKSILGCFITDSAFVIKQGLIMQQNQIVECTGNIFSHFQSVVNDSLKDYPVGSDFITGVFIHNNSFHQPVVFLKRRFDTKHGTLHLLFQLDAIRLFAPIPFHSLGYIIITSNTGRVLTFQKPQNFDGSLQPFRYSLFDLVRIIDPMTQIHQKDMILKHSGQLVSDLSDKTLTVNSAESEFFSLSGYSPGLPIGIHVYLPEIRYAAFNRPFFSRIYLILISLLVLPALIAWVVTVYKTTRQAKETARLLNEKHNRSLFENSPVGLAIIDPASLMIVDLNTKLMDIFGLKEFEPFTIRIDSYFSVNDLNYEKLTSTTTEEVSCEKCLPDSDGNELWLSVTISLIDDLQRSGKLFLAAVNNITEIKLGRAILERFRAALDSASDAIFIFDENGKLIDFNKRAEQVLICPREKLFSMNPMDISAAFSKSALGEYLLKKHESDHRSVSSLIDAHGNQNNVEIKFNSLTMQGKQYIVASARDISWILKYEEQLKQREEELNEAHSIGKIGSWQVDLENKTYMMSESVSSLFGQEVPRKGYGFDFLYKLVHPEDYRRVRNEIKRGKFNEVSDLLSYRTIQPDGRIIWVEAVIRKIVFRGRLKPVLYGTLQDISYRTANEKLQDVYNEITELIASDLSLESLYAKIHITLSKIINVKNFYLALYDSSSGIISFPYFRDEYDDVFPDQQIGSSLSSRVIKSGKTLMFRGELKKKLVETGEVQVHGTDSKVWLGVPLKVDDAIIGLMVTQDYKDPMAIGPFEEKVFTFVAGQVALAISGRQKSEMLKDYSDKLLQSNKSKERLLSLLAHDLRSPYTSILGITEILENEYDSLDDAERKSFIDKLARSLNLQYELVNNLLKWIMLQTDKISAEPVLVDLSAVVQGVLDIYTNPAEAKSISIKTDIPDNCIVYADKSMTETIVRNLVSNAIKFTSAQGSISIRAVSDKGRVILTIADTGIGMSEEVLHKLFVQNSSYTSRGTKGEKGSGFGLVMIREMIEKLNGTFAVQSKPGEGTTFTITLPKPEES